MKFIPEILLISGFVVLITSVSMLYNIQIAGIVAGSYLSILSLIIAKDRAN